MTKRVDCFIGQSQWVQAAYRGLKKKVTGELFCRERETTAAVEKSWPVRQDTQKNTIKIFCVLILFNC